MKKTLFILFLLAVQTKLQAQKGSSVGINVGPSFFGTGDIIGQMIGVEFNHHFSKKLMYSIEIHSTTHKKNEGMFVEGLDGNPIDIGFRNLTSAYQGVFTLKTCLIKNKPDLLLLNGGVVLRYQHTTVPFEKVTLFPIVTRQPYPLTITYYNEKSTTLAFGYTTIGKQLQGW